MTQIAGMRSQIRMTRDTIEQLNLRLKGVRITKRRKIRVLSKFRSLRLFRSLFLRRCSFVRGTRGK